MKFPSCPASILLLMPLISFPITGANALANPFAHAQVINDVDSDCWYKQCTNAYFKATEGCAKDNNVDMSKIDETAPEWKSYRTCFCERGDPFLEECLKCYKTMSFADEFREVRREFCDGGPVPESITTGTDDKNNAGALRFSTGYLGTSGVMVVAGWVITVF